MPAFPHQGPILLFDGACNLCNSTVRFLIPRDPGASLRFCSLQSPKGQKILRQFGLPVSPLPTVVLVEGGQCHLRSTAALKVMRRLAWPWKALYVLMAVPRPLRDIAYNLVANNRYRLLGRRETCMVPGPDLADRFLE